MQNFLFKWTFFDILDTPPKKISALICENLVRLTLKMFKLQKKEPQNFQKKRFPKKIISIIHNLLYLPFKKTLWTKIWVNEWLLQKKEKKNPPKIHYRLHAYFLNFTLILAFWFISQIFIFFVFFKCSIYIMTITNF